MNKLAHDKLDFVICGDSNIDLLKHKIKQTVNKYVNAVHTEGCLTLSTNQRALLTLVQLCLTVFTQTYLKIFQVGE